jgi:hypothetical protein
MSKRSSNSPQIAFPWREPFLAALRQHSKVGDACKAANISRNSVYAHRQRYLRFRKRWERAQKLGCDERWDARFRAADDEFFAELQEQTSVRSKTIAV